MNITSIKIITLINNLVITIAFLYLLIEKIDNKKNVKIPFVPLILFLVYVIINLFSFIASGVSFTHILLYIISLISLTLFLYLKINSQQIYESFSNNYDSFNIDPQYATYYNNVMSRGKYEYVQPYKMAFSIM